MKLTIALGEVMGHRVWNAMAEPIEIPIGVSGGGFGPLRIPVGKADCSCASATARCAFVQVQIVHLDAVHSNAAALVDD